MVTDKQPSYAFRQRRECVEVYPRSVPLIEEDDLKILETQYPKFSCLLRMIRPKEDLVEPFANTALLRGLVASLFDMNVLLLVPSLGMVEEHLPDIPKHVWIYTMDGYRIGSFVEKL